MVSMDEQEDSIGGDNGELTDDEEITEIANNSSHGSTDSSAQNSSAPVLKKQRLTRTKPFTNPVHQWFNDDNDGKGSVCTLCSKQFSNRHATTLVKHLESTHPDQFKEYKKLLEEKTNAAQTRQNQSSGSSKSTSQVTILESFRQVTERKNGLKKGSEAYEKIARSMASVFADCSLPHRLVEHRSWKKFVADVSEGRLVNNLPNRQDMSRRITNLTEELISKMQGALLNAKYVSLTLDLWSRPGNSSAMMGITCHYFDRKSNVITRLLLACRTIKQPHTGENIYALYDVVRQEWNLDENRILRIVTDNGSNVVKAFKDCLLILVEEQHNSQEEPSTRSFEADPNLDESFSSMDNEETEFENSEANIDAQFYRARRISCFAHNMMLAVKTAVERVDAIKNAQEKVLSLIAKFQKSPKAVETLKSRTPNGVGLVKPVRTRWIYWYYVFDRLMQLKRHVCDVCDELNIIHDIGPVDWKMILDIRDVLSPFAKAVTRLEGETYATISEVYPMLYSLKGHLTQFQQQRIHDSVKRMIRKLEADIDFRFKRITQPADAKFDPIYVLATFLDPRYGLILDGDLLEIAKRECKLMDNTNGAVFGHATQGDAVTIPPGPVDHLIDQPGSNDLLGPAFFTINQRRQSDPLNLPQNALDRELELYLVDIKAIASSVDPFLFWINCKDKLPRMSNLAFDVLTIPATSAPAERIFSRASYILDGNRHNLHDKKLEAELLYKANMEILGFLE